MSKTNNRMLGRRTVLGRSFAGLAALVAYALPIRTLANARPFFARTGLPIGLQLYTLGEIVYSDLDGAFTNVAQIGFKTIELVGFRADQPASLRAAADRAGLHITSAHLGAEARDGYPGLGDDPGQLAASIHTLGATVVVLPGPLLRYSGNKPQPATSDDWKRTAAFLNDRGAHYDVRVSCWHITITIWNSHR